MNPQAFDGGTYYGSFGVSQTVFSENQRSTATSTQVMPRISGNEGWTHPGITTDKAFLYDALRNGNPGTPVKTLRVGNGNLQSFDNPASLLAGPFTSYSTSGDFTDTLMYNPSTNPISDLATIWVPVGRFFWGWDAAATYKAATQTWIAGPAAQDQAPYSTPASNSFFPTYTYIIQDLAPFWVSA